MSLKCSWTSWKNALTLEHFRCHKKQYLADKLQTIHERGSWSVLLHHGRWWQQGSGLSHQHCSLAYWQLDANDTPQHHYQRPHPIILLSDKWETRTDFETLHKTKQCGCLSQTNCKLRLKPRSWSSARWTLRLWNKHPQAHRKQMVLNLVMLPNPNVQSSRHVIDNWETHNGWEGCKPEWAKALCWQTQCIPMWSFTLNFHQLSRQSLGCSLQGPNHLLQPHSIHQLGKQNT